MHCNVNRLLVHLNNLTPKPRSFMNTNYAGFWMRFGAYVIDYIIIYCAQAFIVVPILGIVGINFASQAATSGGDLSEGDIITMITTLVAAASAVALLVTILQLLYFSLMESSKYQGTVGKMALGLIVTDTNGAKLDFVKALIRNLGKIIRSEEHTSELQSHS